MNFGFSIVFFAVWPGGRRCANCRDAHFFERYCDESIFTWKTFKTTMEKKNKKTKSSDPWARSGERPGRGHGSELFVLWEHKNTQKKQKVQTHGQGLGYPHTNQKTKKPKKQETKKPKKQKNKIAHPKGRGSDAECWVLSFCFFLFFCFFGFFFFCFFGLCVWIAIADVPSRDCQALAVVALEARSIHYSTAMFAMT